MAQFKLAVRLKIGRAFSAGQLVVANIHRRQAVALIRKAKVGWLLQKQPPTSTPDPELPLPAWVQGQVVGLGRIALEKPRQRLPGVHHFQKSSIVDQFFVAVGAGCGGVGQLIPYTLELLHKFLIGLAAKAAQRGRFVQAYGRKVMRVNIPIPDALIVGQDDGRLAGFHLGHGAAVRRFVQPQQMYSVRTKLWHDVQRHHDQRLTADVLLQDAAPFQLHDGLAQAEPGKKAAPSTAQRPQDANTLVVFQGWADFGRINLNTALRGNIDLVFQKFPVSHTSPTCFLD